MNNIKNNVLSILLYFIATAILGIYLFFHFNSSTIISPTFRLILLTSCCICLYFAAFIIMRKNKNSNAMKISIIIFLILYIFLLFTLTLFDSFFGRDKILFIFKNKETLNNYITNSVNIVPFKTILRYIDGLIKSRTSIQIVITNILGNLIAFMPFGLLLPSIFKRQRKFSNFLITMILIVLGIELTQFITMSGSFDVDDLILNVLGACIMYAILNIQPLKVAIEKIFFIK